MKNLRVLLAALLIFAMMAPMALADANFLEDEGITYSASLIGKGSYADPTVHADVWEITFPTEEVQFTIDPKKYLSQVEQNAAAVADGTFSSSDTILFQFNKQVGDEVKEYHKGTLDTLKVTSKCPFDVIVDLNIRPTDTNMRLSQSATISTDDAAYPTILFQGKLSSDANFKPISAVGANFSKLLSSDASNFDISGDADSGFTFKPKADPEGGTPIAWPEVEYVIKGEANSASGVVWDDTLTPPDLEMTWYVRDAEHTEMVQVVIPANVAAGTNYIMAADRSYAIAGETVTVYVQPKYYTAAVPAGYIVDVAPGLIKTAVKDWTVNGDIGGDVIEDTTGDRFIQFSNGLTCENNMMKYVFFAPNKDGVYGFTAKKPGTGGAMVDNTITISGAPVIKKRVVTASSQAITT